MHFLDSIRRSGRRLRHAKLRTVLTMLAISVGALALMLTLAAGEGARQFVARLVESNFNSRSLYAYKQSEQNQDNPFNLQNDAPQEYTGESAATTEGPDDAQVYFLDQKDVEKITDLSSVDKVIPYLEVQTEYITASEAKKFRGNVTSNEDGVAYEALAGKIPDNLQNNQIILPEDYVMPLGFATAEDAIGKEVTIQFSRTTQPIPKKTYTVVGVAKKPNGLLGGARDIIMAQKELEAIHSLQQVGIPQYSTLIVYAKDDSQQAISDVQAELLANGYGSFSAKEIAKQVTQAVNIIQYFVAGFGLIALLVSIFGIINTQLISVLERTREIGLMKALGMSGSGVLRLFILEATWIGFGGAALGIFGAYFIAIFVNPFLDKQLGIGGDMLIFLPSHIFGLIGSLMLIAALAGLLPAWKAARLNPVEALRTE